MSYIPPHMRNTHTYKPKNWSRKPVIDYISLKTKNQLFEEYRQENYGKSDKYWNEDE